MRNLKKILALVMALVLSLSLVTIASGADFNDADEIELTEAVDVMTAIGVLEGHNTGDFAPQGTLTREQAAKIITYMLLGDSADRLSVASTSFSDVAANHWSAADIEYCTTLGIIAGYGDGRFNPSGTLTGYAFAKMLLTAIGYDAEIENLTGAGWTINVSRLALQVGLDDGIEDISWGSSITREQAAQMALNAIKTPLVQYDNGVTVIVNGEPVTFGSGDAYYVTTTLAREQRIGRDTLSNTNQNVYTVEFGERYFPRLILTSDGITDAFGRPAHIWTYETEDIGTYVDEDLLVVEYTDSVKGKDAYNDIGYSIINQYGLTVYVDGAACTCIDKTDLSRNNNSSLDHTGKGALTQVFVDHDKEEITFVIINTYLAKVTSDYNTKTESLPIQVYTGINHPAGGTPTAIPTGKRLDVEDFSNLADFGEDDYVKVTMAAPDHTDCATSPAYTTYSVESIEEAEVVSDVILNSYTMTEDNTSDTNTYRLDTMTAQGTTYDAAVKSFFDAGVLYNYNEDRDQLKDCVYNLYLDNYGNVLGIELVEAADNYVFVVGYEVGYSPIVESVDKALVITTDGELKVVSARDDKAQVWSNSANGNKGGWVDMTDFSRGNNTSTNAAINTWFTYTTDENGTYILNKVAYYQGSDRVAGNNATGADISGVYASLATNNTNVNDIVNEATVRPAAYGNNDTVYIAVDADKTVSGLGSIVKVNGVTTGIKNTNIVAEGLYGQNMHNFNIANKGNAGAPANYRDTFFLYNSNGYVTYAVVVGEDMTSADNMAFFATGATGRYYDSTLKGYYVTYDVIMGGELQTVKVLDATASSADPARGDLFKATINADGYISALTGAAANEEYADTTDANMNTTAYKTSGYAQKTGTSASPVKMQLIGATLWITTTTLDGQKHAVIDNDCVVYVKVGSENKYEQYDSIESALGVLANDGSAYVSRVTAICDKNTGYATTLIITETKTGSNNNVVLGGDSYNLTMSGPTSGTLAVYIREDSQNTVAALATKALEDAGYKNVTVVANYAYAYAPNGAAVNIEITPETLYKVTVTLSDTGAAQDLRVTYNGTVLRSGDVVYAGPTKGVDLVITSSDSLTTSAMLSVVQTGWNAVTNTATYIATATGASMTISAS